MRQTTQTSSLAEVRAGKPAWYPDQSIYAELACRRLGLEFREIDGGTGLVFSISGRGRTIYFGAGRSSLYPQNSATAADLATDKYFSNVILEREGIATLGGRYFFLGERFQAQRPPGHDRADAIAYLEELGGTAFAKPLRGFRGDFAQPIRGAAALGRYMDEVAAVHDAILLQALATGEEYRIFVMDGEVVFAARKTAPALEGDGRSSVRELLLRMEEELRRKGISSVLAATELAVLGGDRVPAKGERIALAGRMNLSAGGGMRLAVPPDAQAVYALAQRAARVHGLRVAGVDVFCDFGGEPGAVRIVEVNQNPAIRLLEVEGREDLILHVWTSTLRAVGLVDV